MILAAGLGTRLRPYTLIRPKPLFPVLNVPLLHILLDMLVQAGCDRVVVNCHHLAAQIEAAIADRPEVILQHEPKILGTGGSLRKALPLFTDEPVLVMNGDIYHDVDVRSLMDQHVSGDFPVSMAMHDYVRFNSVSVRGNQVCGFSKASGILLAFTGIHVLDREVIEQIPDCGFYHIIDLYEQLAKDGQIGSVRVDESFWRDIGTPEDYLDLHRELLCSPKVNRYACKDKAEAWCISEQATVADDIVLRDWGAVGPRVIIGSSSQLTRCVVWENVKIASRQQLTDMIVCQDVPRADDEK
ncbi:MAG: NTP transferase domain-containing protein [Deltaproteobacteria bacterium]|nr:NTP transferase domain-containing protein [Deltaproteobacteria bacterium]